MPRITPDPSFYPTAGEAATAAPEQLAYVATIGVGENGDTPPDAIGVIDLNHEIVKTIEPEEIAKKTGYEKAGLTFLRRAWINPDQFWASAFVLAGLVTFLT